MGRTVNGTSSILKAARIICRMVGLYGTGGLSGSTTPAFAAAVNVFVAACQVLEALDDQPYVVDLDAPYGPEDVS